MERLKNKGHFKKTFGLYYEPYYHALCQKLCDMKRRCNSPSNPSYYLYGARGIKVCSEWSDPQSGHANFYRWAMKNGYQKGMSIERIDNSRGYSPQNCKWANPKEQANNRRTNHRLTVGKITKTVSEWAEFFGISSDTALDRYERNLPFEQIFHDGRLLRRKKPDEIPHWIDAESETPEIGQRVLLYLPDKEDDIRAGKYLGDGDYRIGMKVYRGYEIGAWQPLPAAPKEEK